jgi:hypothetical protein
MKTQTGLIALIWYLLCIACNCNTQSSKITMGKNTLSFTFKDYTLLSFGAIKKDENIPDNLGSYESGHEDVYVFKHLNMPNTYITISTFRATFIAGTNWQDTLELKNHFEESGAFKKCKVITSTYQIQKDTLQILEYYSIGKEKKSTKYEYLVNRISFNRKEFSFNFFAIGDSLDIKQLHKEAVKNWNNVKIIN